MAISAFTLKNITFKIGAVDYATSMTRVELTQSTEVQTLAVASPQGPYRETGQTEWTLECEGAASKKAAEDLRIWVFEHAGEEAEFTYREDADSDFEWSGTITVSPSSIGGQAANWVTFSFSAPVKGQPTLTKDAP